MRTRRLILGVGLSLLGLIGSMGTANAAPATSDSSTQAHTQVRTVESKLSPDLKDHLATLPSADKESFVASMLPATETMTTAAPVPLDAVAKKNANSAQLRGDTISPMANGCWTGRVDWTIRATAGNTLYTYYHVGGWCVSGTSVTSAWTADSGGQTHTIGWRRDGRIGQSSGVISNQGRSYTQQKFVLGTGGWDVLTNQPCGRVAGLWTAGYNYSATCGIY